MSKNEIKKEDSFKGKPVNPIVKWPGGKRWMNDIMIAFFEENQSDRFIEPFAGGMAISLAIKCENTLINDINPHLINLYKQIKSGLKITITMEYNKERFYKYRDTFNQNIINNEINTPEMAQLFFYLNKTGFNGMCRFNRSGLFNVPFGKYKSVNYTRDFLLLKDLFSKWEFTSQDFSEISTTVRDFSFIDSPYDESFGDYSKEGFKWVDQERTAEWASKMEGPVVITNKATKRVIELYESYGFEVRVVKARRTISSNGAERKPVWEMVAYKNVKVPKIFMEKSENYKEVLENY